MATKPKPSLPKILAPSWYRPPKPAGGSTPGYKPPAGMTTGQAVAAGTPAARPPDAKFLADINTLGYNRDTTLTNLTAGRSRTLGDYGFTETNIDPQTGVGALAFDPNNPYSKAALLKQSYDRNRAATAQSMGSMGQTFSGAGQASQNALFASQAQDQAKMRSALTTYLAGNTVDRTTAQTGYETGAMTAEGNRQGRISTNPLYDPQAAPTSAAPTKAAVATNAVQKTVNGKRFYQRASDKKWIPL